MAQERRGFAGFDSMVTDLSDLPSPLPTPSLPSSKAGPAPVTKPDDGHSHKTVTARPAPRSGLSPKWGVAVLVVGGLVAAFLASNTGRNRGEDWSGLHATPPAENSPTNAYPSSATAKRQYTPAPPEIRAEEKPPVGEDLVLSTAQLRYCLAQGARIDGGQRAVDTSSELEINRFNALVGDYNIRCSKFRYYSSAMNAVKAEVAARRSELEAEGVALIGSPYSR